MIVDCVCVFDARGHLATYCGCAGPRRPPRYLRPHVEMRGPGERLPGWTCRCTRPDGRPLLKNDRHTRPAQCLPQAVIDRWAQQVGCGPRVARDLFYLELEFGTHV